MARYCTHCGRQISEQAVFCKHCGQKVDIYDAAAERAVNGFENPYNKEQMPKKMIAIIAVSFGLILITAIVGAVLYFGGTDTAVPANNAIEDTEDAEDSVNYVDPDSEESTGEEESSAANMIPGDAIEYNGHYYKLYNETMLWTEAEETCEKMNGHLVIITSEEEQQKVVELIEQYASNEKYNFWIGGSDAEQEGVFRWVSGETIPLDMSVEGGYENWKGGQPNNNDTSYEGDQDYLQICCTDINDTDRYGKWYDMSDTGLSQSYEGPPYYKDPKYSGYICEWDQS